MPPKRKAPPSSKKSSSKKATSAKKGKAKAEAFKTWEEYHNREVQKALDLQHDGSYGVVYLEVLERWWNAPTNRNQGEHQSREEEEG